MSLFRLACIVEGHGDERAVRVLVPRVVASIDPTLGAQVDPVIRVRKDRLIRPDELERTIELAARKVGGAGGILVLIDSDDHCPAELGPTLLRRATRARGDVPIAVVLAKREFEAWFLAAAESLRGHANLPTDLQAPTDPEAIRGAKEWLTARMPRGEGYVATRHQAALAACIDLDQARRAPSFDKYCRDIARLMAALRT